eukprot:365644_1
MSSCKAVIFDLGGVVFGSPLQRLNEYEKVHNLPHNFINICILQIQNNAFKRMERGEITVSQFHKQFKKELDNPSSIDTYINYIKTKKNIQLNRNDFPKKGFNVDTINMFNPNNVYGVTIHNEMLHCLFMLRGLGIITIALTNNFEPLPTNIKHKLLSFFDEIIESSVIGLRKPNPNIYKYALKRINAINNTKEIIHFENVIFLDDIGTHLKSAAKLGINTIKVKINRQKDAIKQLECMLCLDNDKLVAKYHKPLILTYNNPIYHKMNYISFSLDGCAANKPIIILHDSLYDESKYNGLVFSLLKQQFFVIGIDLNDRLNKINVGDKYLNNLIKEMKLHYRKISFMVMSISVDILFSSILLLNCVESIIFVDVKPISNDITDKIKSNEIPTLFVNIQTNELQKIQ